MRSVVGMFAVVMACGGAESAPVEAPPAREAAAVAVPASARVDVDLETFAAAQAAGAVVIDVRTPEEYAAGHVPGAVNVPLDQLGPSHAAIASLDRAQPVYFICQVGGRSQRAADLMAEAGYQAKNVLGGTGAWVQAGKAVE